MDTLWIKAVQNDDIRRFRIGQQSTFDQLETKLKKLFGIEFIVITWKDNEDDNITIANQNDWAEARSIIDSGVTLKLFVKEVKAPKVVPEKDSFEKSISVVDKVQRISEQIDLIDLSDSIVDLQQDQEEQQIEKDSFSKCISDVGKLESPAINLIDTAGTKDDVKPCSLKVYNKHNALQWHMIYSKESLRFTDPSGYYLQFKNQEDADDFFDNANSNARISMIQGGNDWNNDGGLTLYTDTQRIGRPDGTTPFHSNEARYELDCVPSQLVVSSSTSPIQQSFKSAADIKCKVRMDDIEIKREMVMKDPFENCAAVILYRDAKGNVTRRGIDHIKVGEQNFSAFCQLRKQGRTFRYEGIEQLTYSGIVETEPALIRKTISCLSGSLRKFVVNVRGEKLGICVGDDFKSVEDNGRASHGIPGDRGTPTRLKICKPEEAMSIEYQEYKSSEYFLRLLSLDERDGLKRCLNIDWWDIEEGVQICMYDAYPKGDCYGQKWIINEDKTISPYPDSSLAIGLRKSDINSCLFLVSRDSESAIHLEDLQIQPDLAVNESASFDPLKQDRESVETVDKWNNFILGAQYSQINLPKHLQNLELFETQKACTELALERGAAGYFYQQHTNGHEIVGFYMSHDEMKGAHVRVRHGHRRGFIVVLKSNPPPITKMSVEPLLENMEDRIRCANARIKELCDGTRLTKGEMDYLRLSFEQNVHGLYEDTLSSMNEVGISLSMNEIYNPPSDSNVTSNSEVNCFSETLNWSELLPHSKFEKSKHQKRQRHKHHKHDHKHHNYKHKKHQFKPGPFNNPHDDHVNELQSKKHQHKHNNSKKHGLSPEIPMGEDLPNAPIYMDAYGEGVRQLVHVLSVINGSPKPLLKAKSKACKYNKRVMRMVQHYQGINNLSATGVYDEITRETLLKAYKACSTNQQLGNIRNDDEEKTVFKFPPVHLPQYPTPQYPTAPVINHENENTPSQHPILPSLGTLGSLEKDGNTIHHGDTNPKITSDEYWEELKILKDMGFGHLDVSWLNALLAKADGAVANVVDEIVNSQLTN